jgi:hypothetical protein
MNDNKAVKEFKRHQNNVKTIKYIYEFFTIAVFFLFLTIVTFKAYKNNKNIICFIFLSLAILNLIIGTVSLIIYLKNKKIKN